MPDPRIFIEFECVLNNGERVYISAVEGRDDYDMDAERIRFELHPDDFTTVEHLIARSQIAAHMLTRRIEQPEVTTEDSGRLRLVGVSPE